MAGYSLYGGSTQLVLCKFGRVYIYGLDPIDDKWSIMHDNFKMKDKGNIYSINESNKHDYNFKINNYIDNLINENYSARWVGSLVADAHRTLLKGGLFAYPGNKKNKEGKIRLLYEAYPFAYIFEKAGGKSSNGDKNILDVSFPKNIHQKTSILLSSPFEFDIFNRL